jgi:hypothetical protein
LSRKIAILEDNLDRQTAMQALLTAHFPTCEHFFCDEAELFIAWLRMNLADTLFISLDHDLELKPTGDGRWFDPGTGRMVADFLATCAPACPIIIHSTNRDAVIGMEMQLQERGWSVDIVTPYSDLVWIVEAWWPAVRRCVVSQTP